VIIKTLYFAPAENEGWSLSHSARFLSQFRTFLFMVYPICGSLKNVLLGGSKVKSGVQGDAALLWERCLRLSVSFGNVVNEENPYM